MEAKLNYRKFNWWHTQWAYAGVRDPEDTDFQVDKGYDDGKWVWTGDTSDVAGKIKEIPNLPIVVMASTKATLKVSVGGNSDSRPIDPKVSVGGKLGFPTCGRTTNV